MAAGSLTFYIFSCFSIRTVNRNLKGFVDILSILFFSHWCIHIYPLLRGALILIRPVSSERNIFAAKLLLMFINKEMCAWKLFWLFNHGITCLALPLSLTRSSGLMFLSAVARNVRSYPATVESLSFLEVVYDQVFTLWELSIRKIIHRCAVNVLQKQICQKSEWLLMGGLLIPPIYLQPPLSFRLRGSWLFRTC